MPQSLVNSPNGEWLQWSPTLLFEDNGPAMNDVGDLSTKVLADGGGEMFVATDTKLKCSNVQRSVFNEDTCFLSTTSTACSATQPVGEVVQPINETTINAFYDLVGRYVYAVKGLVMENIEDHPCSKDSSRWVRAINSTCENPTPLQSNTTLALTNALTGWSNDNGYVVDVLRYQDCDPLDYDGVSDPIHIEIQVGEDCLSHVHSDHLNVYDFTGWALKHPG